MPESCFLRSALFAEHGLHGIFSLRGRDNPHNGVSPPPFDRLNLADDTGDLAENALRNLDILIAQSGVSGKPHRAKQVHGCKVLTCSGAGNQHRDEADILLSCDTSPLAVRVADCTPILLADPTKGLLAAAHAGWRGTVQNASAHAVQALLRAGGSPEHIIASIGPCIGPCCFEVGEETAEALRHSCPGADAFVRSRNGHLYADLAAINQLQLVQAGIGQANIELVETKPSRCTCCNDRYFFSYRRDGRISGRHLAIVASMTPA